jgi:hypothetical protein
LVERLVDKPEGLWEIMAAARPQKITFGEMHHTGF